MRKRKLLLIVISLGAMILLNYSLVIYQLAFGNGGTCVEHYNFNSTGDNLPKTITEKFNSTNSNSEQPLVTSVLKDGNKSGYTYVRLYSANGKENIHLWVRTKDDADQKTEIVFYGISNSENYHDCTRINLENFITREIKLKKFEALIINQL